MAALAFVALTWSRGASAQQTPCAPPWCFETPTVTVQTPTVQGRAQADARGEAQARAEMEARARAWAMWRDYWNWEGRLRADAGARVNAQIDGELAQLRADPWARSAPPRIAAPAYDSLTVPRFEGGATVCAGTWSGAGVPIHYGICAPVHLRLSDSIGVAVDPSVIWFDEGSHTFASAGVSPGLLYSFAAAGGSLTGSHAFVSAGLDAWVPFTERDRSPSALFGAHVGVGGELFPNAGSLGLIAETRLIGRVGTGGGDAEGVANTVAEPRIGFEVRFGFLIGN